MKKKRNWLCILIVLVLILAQSTVIYGDESGGEEEDVTLSPYFFIKNADPAVDSLPLKETKVDTNINGVIAETYVTQTYANEGKNPINASYVFPASTKVSVHGMKMEIGNEVITAKIKEKEEAKAEFEEAKEEGKSASLLEQQRANVFTMDVANIMPGDTVKIQLHYTELIDSTEGTYEFVFPTVSGPRYPSPSEDSNEDSNQWVASPYLKEGQTPSGSYEIAVNLSTGVPITDLACKSHEVNITYDNESTAKVTLSNPEDYAGNRDFILDYKLTGEDVGCGLMLQSGEKENFFMLMVQPPERVKTEDIPPREYIFVLDVSGSMYGYPLDTAKDLIRDLVTSLKETDTFNLILFSDEFSQMSPESVSATAENIEQAVRLIDQQEGGGGTELAPALQRAMDIPRKEQVSRSIVTITDGYLSGEKEIFEMIDKNLSTTSFFSFGIGTAVNRYLIDGIAKAGQGEAFVVTDPADASETAGRFRTYIQSPVLTDIQVSYDGFDVYDTQPSSLPTLFAQKPITIFGKWKGEPAGTIRITGKTGNQDYAQDISVSETKPLEANNALPYLWARKKVEALMDYGFSEDEEAVKKEVTQLGLDYSMLTSYTSFIAVTETVRNTEGGSTDVNQPQPLPQHVSNLSVGSYTTGSEPGLLIIGLFMAAMALISGLYGIRKKRAVTARGKKDDLQ